MDPGLGVQAAVAAFGDLLDQLVAVGRAARRAAAGRRLGRLRHVRRVGDRVGGRAGRGRSPGPMSHAEVAGVVAAAAPAVVGATASHVVGVFHGGSLSVWRRRRDAVVLLGESRRDFIRYINDISFMYRMSTQRGRSGTASGDVVVELVTLELQLVHPLLHRIADAQDADELRRRRAPARAGRGARS